MNQGRGGFRWNEVCARERERESERGGSLRIGMDKGSDIAGSGQELDYRAMMASDAAQLILIRRS